MTRKIGILGSGDVGRALGTGFAALGDEVMIGSRDASKKELVAWRSEVGARGSLGSFAVAARFGEIVLLCTAWDGTKSCLDLAGAQNLAGKVLVDVTNPLDFSSGFPPKLALGHTDSGGEQIQRWLPDSRVVKCFNTVGNKLMFKPELPGGPPTMFLCGDDAAARQTVRDICVSFGWPEVIDIGGIAGSRLLEPLCILWVGYGAATGSWTHAFKLLKK